MESSLGNLIQDWSLDSDVTDLQEVEDLRSDDAIESGPGDVITTAERNVISQLAVEDVFDADLGNDVIGSTAEDDAISSTESIEVNPFDGLPYSSMYHQLLRKRRHLPVWQAKDDFVLAADESSVVLVTGRAGSGKSTQIPQWCAQLAQENNFQCGTVVCTQPSPHAAMSLAIQVSREMDFTEVGNEVGFKVPQADCTCENTILTFCTDEILLREMADDPLLQKYNYVVIDEAQERTVATDMLLALFKSIENARDDLKVIIISLSFEMEKLEDFFEEVPVIDLHFLEDECLEDDGELIKEEDCNLAVESSQASNSCYLTKAEIPGAEAVVIIQTEEEKIRREKVKEERIKQLKIIYLPTDASSLVKPVVDLVVDLHCDESIEGDFLVFLPTSQEVEEACDCIARGVAIRSLRGEAGEISVAPLHSSLTYGRQQVVYDGKTESFNQNATVKKRLVTVSNELAESLFSLENIKVVIDTGVKEEEVFNCRTRTKSRLRKHISSNSAHLRSYRCAVGGRLYRMYSEHEYEAMSLHSIPSIKRIELTQHILLLKRLLQRLSLSFSGCQFIDPPDPETYMLALEELDYHGGLDENGNLSDLGAVMSEFPLNLQQAKCIIASCGEDCVQEMLTIVAMTTSPSCWSVSRGFEEEANSIQQKMAHKAGDHFTLLNIFQRFLRHKRSESWCLKNFISFESMKVAEKKRAELLAIMERLELPISEPIVDEDLLESSVKRSLLAGFFMQVARDTDGCGNYLIIRDRHVARLDPASFFDRTHEWIVYDDFHLTQSCHVTVVSHVTPHWIAEISPQSYLMNLPPGETKTRLLKLSARWRKKLAQAKTSEGKNEVLKSDVNLQMQRRLEKQHCNVERNISTSSNLQCSLAKSRPTKSSVSSTRGTVTEQINLDDTDVLTQAAHSMTQAYHQAEEYVSNIERGEAEDQCVVQ